MSLPRPDELLPLRPPALLLDALLASDEHGLVALGVVPAHSPFVEDGVVPGHIALEIAAQAAGAHGQLQRAVADAGPPPGEGYLVVLREVTFTASSFAVGEPMRVEVELDGDAAALGFYRFQAGDVAHGVLGVYVPS